MCPRPANLTLYAQAQLESERSLQGASNQQPAIGQLSICISQTLPTQWGIVSLKPELGQFPG